MYRFAVQLYTPHGDDDTEFLVELISGMVQLYTPHGDDDLKYL